MTVEKRRIQVERRFGNGHLIVTSTSASSIYNHCGSRAILGLHVNGKKLFFVCCLSLYWWKLLSFFGTYALDISSLTSSIKYISEKYKPLRLCHILRCPGVERSNELITPINSYWSIPITRTKSNQQTPSQSPEILLVKSLRSPENAKKEESNFRGRI